MPHGKGYTVEEQLTGKAEVGGIQFDILERLYNAFDAVLEDSEGEELVLDAEDLFPPPSSSLRVKSSSATSGLHP